MSITKTDSTARDCIHVGLGQQVVPLRMIFLKAPIAACCSWRLSLEVPLCNDNRSVLDLALRRHGVDDHSVDDASIMAPLPLESPLPQS